MFKYQYANLYRELHDAVEVSANLQATLALYSGRQRPERVDLWAKTQARYIQLVLSLALCLAFDPEWAGELDKILQPIGCPAQKVPLMEMFLREKGMKPDEGVAMVVPG